MNQTPMRELKPVGTTENKNYVPWSILLSALLLAGITLAFAATSSGLVLPWAAMLFWASVGTAACIFGRRLQRRNTVASLLWLAPWPLLAVVHGITAPLRGLTFWLNTMITRWNQLHEGGAALFRGGATQSDWDAFAIVMAILSAQAVWWLVAERKILLVGVMSFFWLILMTVTDCSAPLAIALLLASILGVSMSAAHVPITLHTMTVSALLTAALALCAVLLPAGEMASVQRLREDLTENVETLRYGEKNLPEGNLYQASTLQSAEGELLTVETQQAKAFYLRGFVGSVYRDGCWESLPDSALGGDNAGMLQWLAAQGFDPLTQSALYWQLDGDTPEANTMHIQVQDASRYYLYAPVSLMDSNGRDVNGELLRSKGLLGARDYTYQELSDYRPAELMVASPWVSNPRTEEQTRYSQAEAVYRQFVYDNYTALDADTNDLMQRIFWDGYDSEASGIYSAVSHVRDVLKTQVSYDEAAADVPENADPVQYFLTISRRGNAALYASATVQALRAKGIPARYVEGYYLPQSEVEDGTATVTGKDAHAWAEAYFDGIGWLPLDSVPGCYYEAVTLQQMVGAPDAVHKTAALQDNANEAAQITDEEGGAGLGTPLEVAKNLTVLLLGVLALLMLLLAVITASAEVMRGLRYRLALHGYKKAAPDQRARVVERYLYRMLHILGVDACLGWNTAALDEKIAERFIDVEPGEYTRVCRLIERTIYGGDTPDLREERAMQSFLFKLAASAREEPLHTRLRLRYTCP